MKGLFHLKNVILIFLKFLDSSSQVSPSGHTVVSDELSMMPVWADHKVQRTFFTTFLLHFINVLQITLNTYICKCALNYLNTYLHYILPENFDSIRKWSVTLLTWCPYAHWHSKRRARCYPDKILHSHWLKIEAKMSFYWLMHTHLPKCFILIHYASLKIHEFSSPYGHTAR